VRIEMRRIAGDGPTQQETGRRRSRILGREEPSVKPKLSVAPEDRFGARAGEGSLFRCGFPPPPSRPLLRRAMIFLPG
jgi:hypothetical protein